MSKTKLFTMAVCTALVLALAGLAGCSGNSTKPDNSSSANTTNTSNSESTPSEDKHASYFIGKWDLYSSDEATHEQIVEVMDKYANDEETRKKMDEAYGRTNIEFCCTFNADGTGEIDTGAELVPFTWEAKNEGAVTFTSFNGKETALHIPVTDDKITVNGDTYAKGKQK